MKRPNVALNIDELVLHGFAARDRHRIAEAVQREMTRLITLHGMPDAWRTNPPVMQAQQFTAVHDAKPHALGTAIARSVYGSTPR